MDRFVLITSDLVDPCLLFFSGASKADEEN
jgi:hypothetical protein